MALKRLEPTAQHSNSTGAEIKNPSSKIFTAAYDFITWCLVQQSGNNRLILLTYLFTYSMEKSPSWEANLFSASEEIPRIL
jgi:hypothetical protein